MPQVTFYLRKEDVPRWKALKNKAESIHILLNQKDDYLDPIEREVFKQELKKIPKRVSTVLTAKEVVEKLKPDKDFKFCKHGAVLGFCKKGCK